MQAIIVASNAEDRDYLSFTLRHAGLAVARTADAQQVRSALLEHTVDLILLVLDPRSENVRIIEDVRTITQAPFLLVSERLTEEQHCALLDAGADLILERPISPRLLSRYAHILLRRAGSVPMSFLPVLEAPGISLDPATHRVTLGENHSQHLTPLEFRLLYLLMTNRGQVLPSDVIVERVWGYSGGGNRDLVRGLIRRLRQKIEPEPGNPRFIENIIGVGYRFLDE